MIEYNSGYKII